MKRYSSWFGISGMALVALGVLVSAAAGAAPAAQTLEPFTDQACLDCHTDEARLRELAVEEESPEALSSGPG